MPELKEKQKLVYEYLLSCASEGLPPTVREICAATGIRSTSTVFAALKRLEEYGLIECKTNSSRNITLTNASKQVSVPVVGTVTAGVPILAQENIEKYVPLSTEVARGRDIFALRVKGMSMMNAGILDGDIVYVEKTASAEQGEIVVALIEDEATVKRYTLQNGRVVLMPENDAFEPIVPEQMTVLGKVVASFREYKN